MIEDDTEEDIFLQALQAMFLTSWKNDVIFSCFVWVYGDPDVSTDSAKNWLYSGEGSTVTAKPHVVNERIVCKLFVAQRDRRSRDGGTQDLRE